MRFVNGEGLTNSLSVIKQELAHDSESELKIPSCVEDSVVMLVPDEYAVILKAYSEHKGVLLKDVLSTVILNGLASLDDELAVKGGVCWT